MNSVSKNQETNSALLSHAEITKVMNKMSSIIKLSCSYKIGKTGERADERFKNGYEDEYDEIKVLYTDKSPNKVSRMESILIDSCKEDPKCQNVKDGGHSVNDWMTDKNGEYITYIVYKRQNHNNEGIQQTVDKCKYLSGYKSELL